MGRRLCNLLISAILCTIFLLLLRHSVRLFSVLTTPLLTPLACHSHLHQWESKWWERGGRQGPVGWFNASVIYLKPHKTGSESFNIILRRVAKYYRLTHDTELNILLPIARDKTGRRTLLRRQYDILLRHDIYRANVTEHRLKDWTPSSTRPILRIVTIRNPAERLFSHYFSQRRFGRFIPSRGNFSVGALKEEEEVLDFLEWLNSYNFSQQTRYLADQNVAATLGRAPGSAGPLVESVTKLYDHVIVVEQWRLSLCVFGFSEGIKPELLGSKQRNWARADERRFDVERTMLRVDVWQGVLKKVEYDWVLYTRLFRKFSKKMDELASPEFWEYCRRVGDSKLGGGGS